MLRINCVEEDIKKLHDQRYHHPHPLVQRKMEAIYLKSQGVKHKDIYKLCQISKTTLLTKIASLGLTVSIVLILDNARYQKCKLVNEKAEALGIELCYLPAYSPQLNLIERLWKFVRNECLYSKYYENFADFKAAISTWIGTANTERKEKLDSLLTLNFQSFTKVHVLAV